MHLVIDGYNLIHRIPLFEAADQKQEHGGRRALCMALSRYRRQRGHRVTLVLDGGGHPGLQRTVLHGIQTIFAGWESSADEVIKALARRQGPGLTVISDDQELAQACRLAGAEVIGAGEFGQRLLDVAYPSQAPAQPPETEGSLSTKKKGPSRRLPKKKRRQRRRLDRI